MAKAYAARFDDLLSTLARRRRFREYLAGLLLPRDRNKTLTCLAGAEPVVGAQRDRGSCHGWTVAPRWWVPAG
ncbi:hypothetical protein OG209_02745 [Streptomyces sp. NBC_01383]|uniref:hypothetical protein n=1 Tax=Streptomyces sp. NBC_01383 TaxID=2903846 RepID=UPI003253BFEB